jgi:DNA-binding phage protein
MTKLTKNYQESLLAALQDPAEAAEYLNAALEEGDRGLFLLALRNVAEAKGISYLATEAHLSDAAATIGSGAWLPATPRTWPADGGQW